MGYNSSNNEPTGVQLVFGLLSNVDISNTSSETNVITLDQINLDYNLFKYLFYYTPTESFNIAKANDAYSLLKYQNLTLNGNPVSLVDIFLSTFENTTNVNRNSLSPLKTITLVKNLSSFSSIVDVEPYTISLSYPDLISALTQALVIQPSNDQNVSAQATVLLSTKIFSSVLNVSVTLNIPFTTYIPGFTNSVSTNPIVPLLRPAVSAPVVAPAPAAAAPSGVAPRFLPVSYSSEEIIDLNEGDVNDERSGTYHPNLQVSRLSNVAPITSSDNSVEGDNSSEDVEAW